MTQTDAILQTFATFLAPGQVTEIRALHVDGKKAVSLVSSGVEELLAFAQQADHAGAKGTYFVPNPIRPDLAGSKASCRKTDIVERHWLLIDVDPVRPAGASTAEERAAAWQVLSRVRGTLDGHGLTGAVVGDSGSGFHCCYPVLLPNDAAAQELVKAILQQLQKRLGTTEATIDTGVHDAPRIWKLYGTKSRKGEDTEERPHRFANLIEGPAWAAETAAANAALLPQLLERWRWADDHRRGRPETNAKTYAEAALRQEADSVANAPTGTRNNRLNEAAVKCGSFIPHGLLDEVEVIAVLGEAATRAGLEPDEIQGTLRSGLTHGKAHPRDLSGIHETNGAHQKRADKPNAETSDDPLDRDATAADLIEDNVTIRWAWERWIPLGVLTVLASEPGKGKTRLCADLARRIYLGLPWPDGSLPTFPAGSSTLWVPADNQHAELGSIPGAFGFPPQSVFLNTTRRLPFGGTMLDSAEDLRDFERRIHRIKPAMVFIDTILNATDKTSHKPEDAKALFVPLQQIAARTGTPIVCVTHLNASGKALGRRIVGQGRSVIQLEEPDPDGQPKRRKLWVVKTNSMLPPPLGITMGDAGNEYDTNPPTAPDEGGGGKRGPDPAKLRAAEDFLKEVLAGGPRRVSETRRMSEAKGIAAGSLYRAKDNLDVEEFEAQGKKWWRLASES